MNIDDIYYEIEMNLIDKNYNGLNLQEKKDLILIELKKYLIDKFYLNQSYLDEDIKEVLNKINTLPFDLEERNDFFTKITFLILDLIETMQSYSDVWHIEKQTQNSILDVYSEDIESYNITLFVIDEFIKNDNLDECIGNIKEKRKF